MTDTNNTANPSTADTVVGKVSQIVETIVGKYASPTEKEAVHIGLSVLGLVANSAETELGSKVDVGGLNTGLVEVLTGLQNLEEGVVKVSEVVKKHNENAGATA